MSSTAPATKAHHNPIPFGFVGILLILGCLYATLLEIQASEAWALSSHVVSFQPNWSIIQQPYYMFVGGLSATVAKAAMWGWGSELVFLICVLGYEAAHESIFGMNKALASWFRTGAFAIIIFNFYTNYAYGSLGSGMIGQLAFAGITSFAVMFFGVIGIRFLSIALNNIR